MREIEERIGYRFKNPELLTNALTHSSYFNENRGTASVCNERLEFLGDAVVGFIVAGYLYEKFPDLPEGRMTRLRAELVGERGLNDVSRAIGLGRYLLLGHGEDVNGGRSRPSINADAVEAVIAAIYLDGGLEAAERFVRRFIIDVFEAGNSHPERDYKSELQELVQQKSGRILEYRHVGESGPDHMKTFTVEVTLNGESISRGEGRSKKDAEQHAAAAALEALK